jgi:hypothetical protein
MPNEKREKLTSLSTLFPEIIYDNEQLPEISLDIWNSYKLFVFPRKQNFQAYDKFEVQIGMSPEKISREYYGDSRLWWLVLMSNDAEDPFTFIEDVISGMEPYEDGRINLLKRKYVGEILINMRKFKNIKSKEYNSN